MNCCSHWIPTLLLPTKRRSGQRGDKNVGGSERGDINVKFTAADGPADFIAMHRLDLVGTSSERGFATQLRDGSHHGNWERLEKSSRLMFITDSGRDLDERCGKVWGVDAG